MNKFLGRVKSAGFSGKVAEYNNYFDKLYISIYKKLQNPEMVEWFPTYECNAACKYCGGYDRKKTANFTEMVPYQKAEETVKSLGRKGIKVWNIGGRWGEPLLYPNLDKVLEIIKECGMYGILITNGLLLNREFMERLAAIKWDMLKISLDACLPDVHDELSGVQGSFKKIDAVLELIKAIKQETNTKFPRVLCCPVVSNANYAYLLEYIDYCIEKKVEEIEFMPIHNIGVENRAKRFLLSAEAKKEIVTMLKGRQDEQRIKHNIDFIVALYSRELEESYGQYDSLYCIHLWKTLVISEAGQLCPCSAIKDKVLKVEHSLLKTWKSKPMQELRNKVLAGEFIDSEACRECCGPLRDETYKFNQYINNKERGKNKNSRKPEAFT